MLDDFFLRALLAGIGVALVAGPLGCVIVWRRLAYFGDTLSHAALLGVTLALLLNLNVVLAVFAVSSSIAVGLLWLQKKSSLSSDALLGILAHSTLALGLVCLAFVPSFNFDLMALLFGDILAVNRSDIVLVYVAGFVVLALLLFIWKRLFATTVSQELAEAESCNPNRINLVFMLLVATEIALSMKIVGVLLITALLIIPAATARRLSTGPEQMAVLASVLGVLSVLAGLLASLQWDTPSGASIVVAASVLFLVSFLPWSRLSGVVQSRRSSW